MESYVARQPIFDSNHQLAAYELLYRTSSENIFPQVDGDVATSTLLSSAFLGFDINELSNNKVVFINFTEQLLLQDTPRLFPKNKIVVEVLEDVSATPEIQEKLEQLSADGYTIALDDFEYTPELEPLIRCASIIKFDFRLTPSSEIEKVINQLKKYNIQFLAEKVESYDEFNKARELGCTLFQGYFFCRPEVLGSRDLGPSKMNMIQLLGHIYDENYEIETIERLINSDVGLSYKLLRYINSSLFSTQREISSIRHAVAFLGIMETRRFISLLLLAEQEERATNELIATSIIRAKFCECLCQVATIRLDANEMFLLGLFSELDTILGTDMTTIMELLPLSKSIKQALIQQEGPLWPYLELTRKYETGDWDGASNICSELSVNEHELPRSYEAAVKLSNRLINA